MKNFKNYLLAVVVAAFILFFGGWLFFTTIGELEKPTIKFAEDLRAIGRQKVINLTFSDLISGLRHISVTIIQDNKAQVLTSLDFPQKGIRQKPISLTVTPSALKLHDGLATLSVT